MTAVSEEATTDSLIEASSRSRSSRTASRVRATFSCNPVTGQVPQPSDFRGGTNEGDTRPCSRSDPLRVLDIRLAPPAPPSCARRSAARFPSCPPREDRIPDGRGGLHTGHATPDSTGQSVNRRQRKRRRPRRGLDPVTNDEYSTAPATTG